jgi:hypothetical protein
MLIKTQSNLDQGYIWAPYIIDQKVDLETKEELSRIYHRMMMKKRKEKIDKIINRIKNG